MTHELIPAYGRDYKSKSEVVADWNAGKDFRDPSLMASGTYANREDFERAGMTSVLLRYKQLTMVALVKRTAKGDWK